MFVIILLKNSLGVEGGLEIGNGYPIAILTTMSLAVYMDAATKGRNTIIDPNHSLQTADSIPDQVLVAT